MYGKELGEVDLSKYELKGELVYITSLKPISEGATPLITSPVPLLALVLVGLALYIIKEL